MFSLVDNKTMSLADATAGIQEVLPAGLDYASVGNKFEAVTSREDTHFFPVSGNYFSSQGIRVIRFNLVTTSYIDPSSFRFQAVFRNDTTHATATSEKNSILPRGPMSLRFSTHDV